MTYTSHGHHIPFTFLDLDERPDDVRRCGGVRLCLPCTMEAARYLPAFADQDVDAVAEQLKNHLRTHGGSAQERDYLLYENSTVAVLV